MESVCVCRMTPHMGIGSYNFTRDSDAGLSCVDCTRRDHTDVGVWSRNRRYDVAATQQQPVRHSAQMSPEHSAYRRENYRTSFSETDSQRITDPDMLLGIRSVTASDVACVEGLLREVAGTQFSSLLRHLVDITYLTHEMFTSIIYFLLDMFLKAMDLKQTSRAESDVIPIADTNKPGVFHLDTWKTLMILLGFTYEELDTPPQNRLEYTTLLMTAQVKMDVLRGMISLLKCMLELTNENIRSLIMMQTEEAKQVIRALIEAQSGRQDVSTWVADIWPSQSHFLIRLGYYKVKEGRNKRYLYNKRSENLQLIASLAVLEAFHSIENNVKESSI